MWLPWIIGNARSVTCMDCVTFYQCDHSLVWAACAELWSQELQQPWNYSTTRPARNGSSQYSDHRLLDKHGEVTYLAR